MGDRAVREYLKRSWKSLPYQEKDRAERDAELANKIEPKYTRLNFRPHYFTPSTWDSLNEYWESPLFKGRSVNAKKARAQLEHIHYSGAMPFDERREVYTICYMCFLVTVVMITKPPLTLIYRF